MTYNTLLYTLCERIKQTHSLSLSLSEATAENPLK